MELIAMNRTKPVLYYMKNLNIVAVWINHSVDQMHEWFHGTLKVPDQKYAELLMYEWVDK